MASAVSATTILTYDFQSLTSGSALVGQDSWVNPASGTFNDMQVTTGGGVNATKVATSNGTNSSAATKDFGTFSLTSSDVLTLDFTVRGTAGSVASNYAVFGFGTPYATKVPAFFGIWAGNWAIRAENNGTITNAVNSSGTAISITSSSWYDVRSVWDLSTGTASLYVKNLTLGETSYTQLFFDAAQTQSTVNLGITSSLASWDTVLLRSISGQIDNLSVTSAAVPEPSTVALMGLGVGALWLLRRRS